jgi:hypothetical protein
MSIRQLLTDVIRYAQEHGIRQTIQRFASFTRESALRTWHRATGLAERGEYVLEKEWDLLVVLDACRADALAEVSDEYPFLDQQGTFESAGSYSLSWMLENFGDDYASEMAETAMVTGNPFSETAFRDEDFYQLEEVWKHTWDDDLGTIPPRPITDHAISLARSTSPTRIIVHYMQPHEPFTTHPNLKKGSSADSWADAVDKSLWKSVQEGAVSEQRAREAYLDELRMILNEVTLLLENVDADKAIISADHGEAMGEAGMYGHPHGVAIDALRLVPWYETTAKDLRTYEPEIETNESEGEQLDRLRDLGYLD